ncbi:MAG: hypothetical protein ACSHYF_10070 [Verrucomicrobiaceae bacterium]
MLVPILSWLTLAIAVALCTWFFTIRGRGSLRYWIRTYHSEPLWVVGQTIPSSDAAAHTPQILTDTNAVIRSLDRRTNKVYRKWDHQNGTLFLGLVLNKLPDCEVPHDYQLVEIKPHSVVRLSGSNRLDEEKHLDALRRFADRNSLSLDLANPVQLSGQSFALFQWDITSDSDIPAPSPLAQAIERTYQLRNNLVIPLLATLLALALIGTGQFLLFAAGIGLITFLSGACKFIFMHQMTDEADEIHLQNY